MLKSERPISDVKIVDVSANQLRVCTRNINKTILKIRIYISILSSTFSMRTHSKLFHKSLCTTDEEVVLQLIVNLLEMISFGYWYWLVDHEQLKA